tara:strand:- start:164 stop:1621 length:1458 start_codon:yes stop_codon:yes gene_type:complete
VRAAHIADLIRQVQQMEEHLEANPLDAIAWLPGQLAWLSDPGPYPKLYRAGVRSGKSLAAVAEVQWRCRGSHPFNPTIPTGPVRCAFVTTDKQAQGVQIMRLFWEMVCKSDLIEGVEFSERTGFRGHVPVVQYKNGSSVTWYSNNAGPKALQGSEYDYIQIDEPCSLELFEECRNRVRNTGGQVGITLTPLHLPVPWLQDYCQRGIVIDHHTPLTLENQISPLTGQIRLTKAGVPWDQTFIDELRATVVGPDAAITLDGEWESRVEGQYFSCFESGRHVVDELPDVAMDWFLGVDYAGADRPMGMAACLTGVHMVEIDGQNWPHFWTLDEVVMSGHSTMDQFSDAICKMLQGYGLEWHDLSSAWGDNPVKTKFQVASNVELTKYIARRIGVRAIRPRLLSVKEGGGASSVSRRSKDLRSRWMWQEMASDRVRIHSQCRTLIKALDLYDYSSKHPYKDITDAWMYGLKPYWTTRARRGSSAALRVY